MIETHRWPRINCQLTASYHKKGSHGISIVEQLESQQLPAVNMHISDDKLNLSIKNCFNNVEQIDGVWKHKINLTIPSKSSSTPMTIDMDFTPLSDPIQMNEGKTYFGANKDEGFQWFRIIPAGKCTGTIRLSNGEEIVFTGQGACVHNFQGFKPHTAVQRWNVAYYRQNPTSSWDVTQSGGLPSLLFIQMHATEDYHGVTLQYGYCYDGESVNVVCNGPDNQVSYPTTTLDDDTAYAVPTACLYQWKGIDFHGTEFNATVEVSNMKYFARQDLLDNVPKLLRTVVQSVMKAKPNMFRYLDQDVTATINSSPVVGTLFQELTFLVDK